MTSAVLPDGIEGWSVRFRLMDTTSLMLVVRTRAADALGKDVRYVAYVGP